MTAQGSFSRMICHEAHMASYDIYLVGFPHRKSDQSERVVNPGALYPSDWVHFAPRLAREANIYEFEPFSRTACTDQDTSLDSSALDSHGTCSQTSIRHDDPSDIKPGTRCNSLLGRELCAGHNDLRELRSSQALHDAARHLLDEAKLSGLSKHSGLSPNRSRWRPIIFAGHGLGGLVVKIALMIADIETHYLDVRLRTHKLILADTPHEADIATWEDVLEDMIKSSRIHIHGRRSSFLADMATSVHEMSDYFKGTLTHLVTDLPDHVEPCTGNLLIRTTAISR
ncbi:hypothetical protein F5Y18DRAFT_68028 [Xylariaceae sp. FL1019]|nr:hypothetical protein F5Y18DRAFT_68028 [Xylariaceae sp. FL1019]